MPDTYFYWGYIRTGGLSLRWFRDNICDKVGESSYYDELQQKAEKVKPGCEGVLFLPYLQGGSVGIENASVFKFDNKYGPRNYVACCA